MIRQLCINLVVLLALGTGTALACSMYDREETTIGPFRAVKGVCSTNRQTVTCVFRGGEGMNCDGPSGSFTGLDLNGLISAACGCSIYQYEYQELPQISEDERKRQRLPCDPGLLQQ